MQKEISYGIIPLQKKGNQWEVLLVQPHQGWWGIPKGHADPGETDQEAAERELNEETGLRVKKYLRQEPILERYHFFLHKQLIDKTVMYFLAEVEGTVVLQAEELKNSQWLNLDKAVNSVTYKETKKVLKQTLDFLSQKSR
ncbi:MAG: bis(5'-nucleosyl)-tetraphosphatase [Parachlamydiaceae bacterium]